MCVCVVGVGGIGESKRGGIEKGPVQADSQGVGGWGGSPHLIQSEQAPHHRACFVAWLPHERRGGEGPKDSMKEVGRLIALHGERRTVV